MEYRESWACAWTDQVVHRIELLVLRQNREEAAETDRQKAIRATELFRSNHGSVRPSDINVSFF